MNETSIGDEFYNAGKKTNIELTQLRVLATQNII